MVRMNRIVQVLLLGGLVVLQGCMFTTLRNELREMKDTRVLTGRVLDQVQPEANVVLVLYRQTPDGLKIENGTLLDSAVGQFVVKVPTGTFYLFAFEDLDNDLSLGRDGAERLLRHARPHRHHGLVPGDPARVRHPPERVGARRRCLPGDGLSPGGRARQLDREGGQVVDLDDPIFSLDYGRMGYWRPLTFIREVGFCIFFREPFDPGKIPVLFVHGAVGTPHGWKDIVARLDPARFQPWFYYYPSGLPLDKNAAALNWMIAELHRELGFRKLYVVAHSMGGLVARDFILKNAYESRLDVVRQFVSISSPWNGHRLTAKGVRRAPEAVPSWHDMVPDSPFIRALFARRLPEFVTYDLLFSFRGDRSFFLENNDGTVEISSQLDRRAQREARRIYGYDEDHGSILTSDETIADLVRLLSAPAGSPQ